MLQSDTCWSWGSPFLQMLGLKGCTSVMLGRCGNKDKSSKEKWTGGIRTTLHGKHWQRLENGYCHCCGTHKCKYILWHHARLTSTLSASDMPGDIGVWYKTGECVTGVWATWPTWSPWSHHVWHKGTPPLASGLDKEPDRDGEDRSSCYCPAKVAQDGGATAGCCVLLIHLSGSA